MTKPNPRIVEPQADDDRGMEMLAYAVIYASIILALCIVAMLYAGAIELPTPDLRSPDYSAQQGPRS
ncbi:MAG: hypothetical protein IPM06_17655 [Rhizobiales bacterium]|nr:hypothetical protein [Hyphomicrobiales bacterium]